MLDSFKQGKIDAISTWGRLTFDIVCISFCFPTQFFHSLPRRYAHFYYSILTVLSHTRLVTLRRLVWMYQCESSSNWVPGSHSYFPVTGPQGEASYYVCARWKFLPSLAVCCPPCCWHTAPSGILPSPAVPRGTFSWCPVKEVTDLG